jgi:hypothetical protein
VTVRACDVKGPSIYSHTVTEPDENLPMTLMVMEGSKTECRQWDKGVDVDGLLALDENPLMTLKVMAGVPQGVEDRV